MPTRSGFHSPTFAMITSFGVSGCAWSNITTSCPARFSTDDKDMMPMGGNPMIWMRPFLERRFPGIA